MRKSNICLAWLALNLFIIGLILIYSRVRELGDRPGLDSLAAMTEKYNLTDLCLFTEARYTRHLSQTDFYSAFQDHPGALEHFPSGSLARPPQTMQTYLEERHAPLD